MEQKRIFKWLAAAVFVAVFGWRFFLVSQADGEPLLRQRIGKSVVLHGIITDEPTVNETSTRVVMAATSLYEHAIRPTLITFSIPPTVKVAYGDEVLVAGVLERPKAFATDNGGMFFYDKYLAARDIFYTSFRPTLTVFDHRKGSWFKQVIFSLKESFIQHIG